MKLIQRSNKPLRYSIFTLLIIMLLFVSIGASSSSSFQQSVSQIAISNYLAAQQDPNLDDEAKIKAAIDSYFTLKYEGQKLLEPQDFSILIENEALDWVKMEKDKRDIEIYVANLYESPYLKYKYTLDYDSIIISGNKATVQLRESNEVTTKRDLSTSYMGNLPHLFILHKIDPKGWVIYQDEYQDEISQGLVLQTKEELLQKANENYEKGEQQSSKFALQGEMVPNIQPFTLNNYPYNRTMAYNYAHTYWNTTNPPYYLGLQSDCANFVSQALYAGEGKTPPNTSGMGINGNYLYDWYYVWNNSGSRPWINVVDQRNFITGNSSRIGPYGSNTPNFCDINIGDVVQLQNASGWFHEGIVVGKSIPCGGAYSIYVASHTTNRWYYNLYNWSMYGINFTRIMGWHGN